MFLVAAPFGAATTATAAAAADLSAGCMELEALRSFPCTTNCNHSLREPASTATRTIKRRLRFLHRFLHRPGRGDLLTRPKGGMSQSGLEAALPKHFSPHHEPNVITVEITACTQSCSQPCATAAKSDHGGFSSSEPPASRLPWLGAESHH